MVPTDVAAEAEWNPVYFWFNNTRGRTRFSIQMTPRGAAAYCISGGATFITRATWWFVTIDLS